MKDYSANHIRNVAVLGHGSEGKTTLCEAMLLCGGATDRQGRVEDGSTVMDHDPEEIKRQISISASVAPVEWKDYKINLIDSPGYFDFIGEMTAALHLGDAALIVVGAMSGLMVGAEKAYDAAKSMDKPRMIVINQIDKEHADFKKALESLQNKYGNAIVVLQIPIVENMKFKGYVDVVECRAKLFDGKKVTEADVPANLQAQLDALREPLIEAAAESDDDLLEKFFGGEELTPDEIKSGLRKSVLANSVVPVVVCAAAQNLNTPAVLDALADYLPAPCECPGMQGVNPKNDKEETRQCDIKEPFSAQVVKTVADPFVGKLSLFKVNSGVLKSDTSMINANTGKNEKVGTIYVMRGKKQIAVDQLVAGDIGAVAKLQHTNTGNTLCEAAHPIAYPEIVFPLPSISLSITAKKEGDEDKVFAGLHRLEEEDPTIKVEKDVTTGDTLIKGLGELHLEVILKKLHNKFGVEGVLMDPKVPYRETIRKNVKAEGKHKKQTGGHGQFGHCWIEFEPTGDATQPLEFVDKIVGGVVPRQYIPAVEKGLRESMVRGVLAGYPMVGIRATLYDGSYHSVDSSEMAFKMAARLAYRKGCATASPVLLEPIYRIEVRIPDEYMGDIIGDMNRRRGRIMGMNPLEGGLQEVVAEVPLAEVFKYATDLRSMTQARGSFIMEFERYEEAPANIAAKVVEQAKHEEEDED